MATTSASNEKSPDGPRLHRRVTAGAAQDETQAAPGLYRAVFLDRDGTLNEDTGYLFRPQDWRWLPGVPQALARLKAAGWLLVVVSNQSGIARGFFGEAELAALEQWANARLAPLGAEVDAWYHCPHLPAVNGPCACRKPAPGLLLQAAREWSIDLAASWMLGDKARDARAGLAAGCRAAWLGEEGAFLEPDLSQAIEQGRLVCLPDMTAACARILADSAF